ncbi:uncharacterized protein PHACADRAFT_187700 [Phanerochaete carnosa HHB-10118-sp]|uniref:SigF-like NTF2-like domain-containing protein n=1 Tax=Phanerochaete carnosa (strain HHB-10118-sp) TaxID=650164 RepID=K5VWW6_PHACS|nr:uncharacterized protein PHACADRAFT_187700 [Phanerochaete carnosa HHB-10118-sp]EKM51094.1 hypothetical protein PHACADRAFT_187700 [Phanerochaete carnosa HHB-10118-sp]
MVTHLKQKPSADDPDSLQIAEHETFLAQITLVIPLLAPVVRLLRLLWLDTVMSITGARLSWITFVSCRVLEGQERKKSDKNIELTRFGVNVHPVKKFPSVIHLATRAKDPEKQESAIPRCPAYESECSSQVVSLAVASYEVNIDNITYNVDTYEPFVVCVQWFVLRCSPVHPCPVRHVRQAIRLKPDHEDANHSVTAQDDWFHPENIMACIFSA